MSEDYTVGYKRPPKHTQWTKGKSGNPRGRPKGLRNLKTELAEELSERILIREGGKQRKVSKQRAFIKALAAKAVQGDPRAAKIIIDLFHIHLQADSNAEAEIISADDAEIVEAFLKRTLKKNGRGEKS